MKAWIFVGGSLYPKYLTERPAEDDLVIAADGGYRNAALLGVTPGIALGDFDSFDKAAIPPMTELLEVPAEKDFTDAQLAVDVAVKRGAEEILILGGLDGRLDHTLSNLAILEKNTAPGRRVMITNGQNRVRYLRETSDLLFRSHYTYFSLLAADKEARGVSVEGGKYPLKNATLKKDYQYAVSNEIVKNCALVSVRRGALFVIESSDRDKD